MACRREGTRVEIRCAYNCGPNKIANRQRDSTGGRPDGQSPVRLQHPTVLCKRGSLVSRLWLLSLLVPSLTLDACIRLPLLSDLLWQTRLNNGLKTGPIPRYVITLLLYVIVGCARTTHTASHTNKRKGPQNTSATGLRSQKHLFFPAEDIWQESGLASCFG